MSLTVIKQLPITSNKENEMAETRIYVVLNQQTGDKRLVEATSQAQAIRHCVSTIYRADVATSKAVAQFMSKGVRIEVAETSGSGVAALIPEPTTEQTALSN
jgi:hypothetical protein